MDRDWGIKFTTPEGVVRACTSVAVVVGVLAVILETHAPIAASWSNVIAPIIWVAAAYFVMDLLLRVWFAYLEISREPEDTLWAAIDYLTKVETISDIIAALAIPVPMLCDLPPDIAHLFGLLWMLKLARYAHGLSLLGRVIRTSADALFSVLLSFSFILIAAATAAYLSEASAQPEQFGSIPLAMWWAIVTLTTTGYGDAAPVTLAGRMLAGVVMVCGIAIFALWAGIIASGFADELRRRDFLRNWELVSKVPFFREVGADLIASVARLLRRRDVPKGQVVVRKGAPGESMFFVVSGELEALVEPQPRKLGPNQFFGELALITGAPRSATVRATQTCVLLELDVADFRQLTGDRPELMKAITAEGERRARYAGMRR